MKTPLSVFGATLGLALLATGCATNDMTARIQEKSAAFATLKVWEKSFIQKGVVSTGFTPDMVYMAVGNPTKVEPVKFDGGGQGELWTYHNFYPAPDATRMDTAPFTTESTFQPAQTMSQPHFGESGYDGDDFSESGGTTRTPMGMSRTQQSIFLTGGPQGGSMEPADLQAFTLYVLFHDGKVTLLSMKHA